MSQQPPYGSPLSGYGQGYPPPQQAPIPKNGLGTTALVLGILAILLAFVPILGFIAYPLAILGIIFGLIAVGRARKRIATNRGVSVAGLVTSLIGLALVIVSTVIYVSAISAAVGNSGAVASGAASGNSGSPCAAAYPDKQSADICADDKSTVILDGMSVNATALAVEHGNFNSDALCSTVTIKNTSNRTQDYNVLDFKLQTPNGVVATASLMSSGETLDSGALIAGGTKSGKVCSEDTAEKGRFVFIYKPNAFEASRGIWLFTV